MPERPPLSPERIVDAAARVADGGGLTAVSMRRVGAELQVEAMSLYHHVANKEALLDGLVDWVFAQVELPDPEAPWRAAMVARAGSARQVMSRHPWALALIESRRLPGPALLRHHESILACLRTNGFSVGLAASAFSALDAYVYGFVLTEIKLPFEPGEDASAFVDSIADLVPADEYPHLVELLADQVQGRDYDYGDEFERGLDLVLDGLEQWLVAEHA